MRGRIVLAIVVAFALAAVWAAGLAGAEGTGAAAKPAYIGSVKCKMCHLAQHKTWAASKHAAAFAALKPEDTKKKECVSCHVTGLTEEAGAMKWMEEDVGCESCHGPGSLYAVKASMDKKRFEADPEGTRKFWASQGLVKPIEATCKGCHNEKSPNFKGFDFAKASTAIKHWKDKAAAPAAK